ncbi:acyl-CoA dehydrogenase [Salsuginibacillus kocurii]|uniref:acyl-CoA dehydrogenase n=1 Tax=Salsuginibacillus kocurii TaxID=427078 RepID=UPI0003700491|nr:acyl-CoA dehydrogenase [Salsuginibacillus kocurii]
MNLHFSEEQQMMRKMVQDFANDRVKKAVKEMEAADNFPTELVKEMGELGLMGIPVPEKYGGSEMDFTSYVIAIHELSKVSPALGVILSVHTSVGTNPIYYFGNDEQKNTYLPKLAKGNSLAAFALTEPGAGSDAAALKTTAVKQGEHYILNGSKVFITNGGAADTYIVFASTNPAAKKAGITAFIVDKETPGFQIGNKEKKMGLRGSNTTELIFEDAKVPVHHRLGEEGEGFKIAMSNLDAGRIGIAAQSLGIAEGALVAASSYAKERKQFGGSIGKQQGIAFKLADMATQTEAAKLLTYHAANLRSQGKEGGSIASMAKLFASQNAMKVATEAVQIFGGYGYTTEYPAERFFRDAKVCEIYEGTSEIQRHVISRGLLDQ